MSVSFQFHLVYMHAARKLNECEGLQVPAKAKPIKQMPIPEKIQTGDILFWKKFLDFLSLSLYPWKFWRKQSFIPGNSTIFCYTRWKFQCHSKNQDPWKSLMNFFITSGNSTCFLLKPCNFHVLFLHLIPLAIPCPQFTLLFGFFLEWPSNWTVWLCYSLRNTIEVCVPS